MTGQSKSKIFHLRLPEAERKWIEVEAMRATVQARMAFGSIREVTPSDVLRRALGVYQEKLNTERGTDAY